MTMQGQTLQCAAANAAKASRSVAPKVASKSVTDLIEAHRKALVAL